MITNTKTVVAIVSVLLLINFVITPALATRTIEVTKELDIRKDLLAKQMTNLESYKEVFPAFVKEVRMDSETGHAKFIIEAQGTQEADVKSAIQQDGSFVIEILSGDLQGSKIITKLDGRTGFDGTPNGATAISSTLILETSWVVSLALAVIDDKTIRKAVGDGFYDLGQYIKHQKPKEQLINANYEMPKLDEKNLIPDTEEDKLDTEERKKFNAKRPAFGKTQSYDTKLDVEKPNHYVVELSA